MKQSKNIMVVNIEVGDWALLSLLSLKPASSCTPAAKAAWGLLLWAFYSVNSCLPLLLLQARTWGSQLLFFARHKHQLLDLNHQTETLWKVPVLLFVLGSSSPWVLAEANLEDFTTTQGTEGGTKTPGWEDGAEVTEKPLETIHLTTSVPASTKTVIRTPAEHSSVCDRNTTASQGATGHSVDGLATSTLVGIILAVSVVVGLVGAIILVVVRKNVRKALKIFHKLKNRALLPTCLKKGFPISPYL
ncbi:PREDICTED: podoplanin-like [Elephantulus edwardii]|uniref:podoplanin-like n=1 Tax=Elephantulus edwardii TaxID=28737 RepID=UPI0003F0DD58|nr:PREDICTED: podoplanin-like [Elephantulus edwardii]